MTVALGARLIAVALLLASATAPRPPSAPNRVTVPCEVLNLRYDRARERWNRVPPPRTPAERNRILRRYT